MFKISSQDWQEAEAALAGKRSGTKYEKYPRDPVTGQKIKTTRRTAHAFVIIDNVIYALANSAEDPPEEGGAALVKKGMTKDGKIVAIKIKSAAMEDLQSDAIQASIKNNLFIGQGVREAPNMRIKLKLPEQIIETNQKLYSVMEWRGDSLISQIDKVSLQLTNTQKWIIGLRACLLVEKLHRDRIVHGDVKAENLTARIQGNDIELKAVDFEFAKILEEGEIAYIATTAKGSPGFASPEILLQKRLSYLSDIFALAIMLLFQIDVSCKQINFTYYNEFSEDVIENFLQGIIFDTMDWLTPQLTDNPMDEKLEKILRQMLHKDVNQRSGFEQMILYLCDKLLTDASLEGNIKAEILEIKAQHVVALMDSLPTPVATMTAATSSAETKMTVAFSSSKPEHEVAFEVEQGRAKKPRHNQPTGHEPKINP